MTACPAAAGAAQPPSTRCCIKVRRQCSYLWNTQNKLSRQRNTHQHLSWHLRRYFAASIPLARRSQAKHPQPKLLASTLKPELSQRHVEIASPQISRPHTTLTSHATMAADTAVLVDLAITSHTDIDFTTDANDHTPLIASLSLSSFRPRGLDLSFSSSAASS